jgi:hypothetical protein
MQGSLRRHAALIARAFKTAARRSEMMIVRKHPHRQAANPGHAVDRPLHRDACTVCHRAGDAMLVRFDAAPVVHRDVVLSGGADTETKAGEAEAKSEEAAAEAR